MNLIKVENIKELFVFHNKIGNRYFLLTRDGSSIILSRKDYFSLKNNKINEELKNRLLNRNLFEYQLVEVIKEVRPTFYLIEITQQCNLKCKYCFRGEHNNKVISFEMLEKVLSNIYVTIKKYNINNFSIQPWGGEPLLYMDRVLFIREYFDKLNLHPHISIETNGVLLNVETLKKLLVADIYIGISIDGIKEIQDNQRPCLYEGQSSSDIVRENIIKIKNKYPNYSFGSISVYTKESLFFLEKNIKYISEDLLINNLKLNIVKDNSYFDGLSMNEKEIEDFYCRMFRYIRKNNQIVESNIFERAYNLIFNYNNNICISLGCMGGYKMVAYSVDGELYNCELIGMDNQKIGNINDDIVDSIEKGIESYNPYYNDKQTEECKSCPWWHFCKGGCSANCLRQNTKYDIDGCIINKTLYPLIINSILKKDKLYKAIIKRYGGRK